MCFFILMSLFSRLARCIYGITTGFTFGCFSSFFVNPLPSFLFLCHLLYQASRVFAGVLQCSFFFLVQTSREKNDRLQRIVTMYITITHTHSHDPGTVVMPIGTFMINNKQTITIWRAHCSRMSNSSHDTQPQVGQSQTWLWGTFGHTTLAQCPRCVPSSPPLVFFLPPELYSDGDKLFIDRLCDMKVSYGHTRQWLPIQSVTCCAEEDAQGGRGLNAAVRLCNPSKDLVDFLYSLSSFVCLFLFSCLLSVFSKFPQFAPRLAFPS